MENWNPRFGDCYFTPGEGINESFHVFYEGNGLETRLLSALRATDQCFVIVETGFGTGLNALVTAAAVAGIGPALSGMLRFISVDKFPLASDDRRKILMDEFVHAPSTPPSPGAVAATRSAAPSADRLPLQRLDALEVPEPGAWTSTELYSAPAFSFVLELYHGDVLDFLGELAAKSIVADAWYLDGHAPETNPEMWSRELFRRCAAVSRPGTSAATYSAAGLVKQGLRQAGFAVRRAKGYGRKRHMVCAGYQGQVTGGPGETSGPGGTNG